MGKLKILRPLGPALEIGKQLYGFTMNPLSMQMTAEKSAGAISQKRQSRDRREKVHL